MIEVRGLDRRGTLAGAEAALAAVTAAEADQLVLAGHWADLHCPAGLAEPVTEFEVRRRRWDGEYGVSLGGEGTPEVLACCLAELGVVLQTSATGARHLVADALDLRHRLPSLWGEVQAGRVRGWKARKVAQATRHLPRVVMGEVDTGLAGLLPALPWSRFAAVLEATVLRADPAGAARVEAEAASRRFVGLARGDVHGLTTLIARGAVLDIVTFLAAVNRVADLLGAEGDPDTVEVRRSKAVGILGQPDRALALLTAHRDDPDRPPVPVEPRQPGGWRRAGPCTDADDLVDLAPTDADPRDGGGDTDEMVEVDEPGRRSLDLTGPAPVVADGGVASVRVQLYVHLTDTVVTGADPGAVCRVEGVGPVTAQTVRGWLRRPEVRVTVRPVVVPGRAVPVGCYEIPASMREAVLLRNPASVFPWSSCTERHALQLDHVEPYRSPARGGPPGQTDPANLAPLAGSEHQRKTSRRWQERAVAAGVVVWRSPHGWVELVTNQGTFPLGTSAAAQAIWHAAAPGLCGSAAAA